MQAARRDPDAEIALSERVTKLKKLTEYPEWRELEIALEERRQFHTKNLTKRIMRGNPIPVEEQLRHAGFWEGVAAVLSTPDAVEKKLAKVLDTAR